MQYIITLSLDVDGNNERTWTITDENDNIDLTGRIGGLDPNSDTFDFDEATTKISNAAGISLENGGTESGTANGDTVLYWDAISPLDRTDALHELEQFVTVPGVSKASDYDLDAVLDAVLEQTGNWNWDLLDEDDLSDLLVANTIAE